MSGIHDDDNEDPLGSARGCLFSVLVGLIFWIVLLAIIWRLTR